jgi:hypothetical protein
MLSLLRQELQMRNQMQIHQCVPITRLKQKMNLTATLILFALCLSGCDSGTLDKGDVDGASSQHDAAVANDMPATADGPAPADGPAASDGPASADAPASTGDNVTTDAGLSNPGRGGSSPCSANSLSLPTAYGASTD